MAQLKQRGLKDNKYQPIIRISLRLLFSEEKSVYYCPAVLRCGGRCGSSSKVFLHEKQLQQLIS